MQNQALKQKDYNQKNRLLSGKGYKKAELSLHTHKSMKQNKIRNMSQFYMKMLMKYQQKVRLSDYLQADVQTFRLNLDFLKTKTLFRILFCWIYVIGVLNGIISKKIKPETKFSLRVFKYYIFIANYDFLMLSILFRINIANAIIAGT